MKAGFHTWNLRLAKLLLLTLLLTACGPADVEVDLPAYEKKLVVEGYLTEGKRLRVSLYESVPYFGAPDVPLVVDAQMTLSYGAVVDTLDFLGSFYQSRDTVTRVPGEEYVLRIELPDGRLAWATTRFLEAIPVDSVSWSRDPGTGYRRVGVHFQDPPGAQNYYRLVVRSYQTGETWDVESDDDLVQGEGVTFFSKAIFEPYDSGLVYLYTLQPEYYEFLASLRKAKVGGSAPVVEPTEIVTNIIGGTGIFTSLNVSEGGVRFEE